jgi:regulatory protein YycI of two-component signal transduction system YycFG
MEWGRAKTILILAFLMLNLILGYQLWQSKLKLPGESNEFKLIVEEVRMIAESKNITINAEVPTETPRMNEITVTFGDEGIIANQVNFNVPYPYTAFLTGSDVWKRISEHIPKANEYRMDPFTSGPRTNGSGVIVLHQLANGYPMFDVRLEIHYEGDQFVSYRQDYVQILEGEQQTDHKVLSAYLAIGRLVEHYMLPGKVITDVQLGYHGQIFNSETQVLAPMWRIMTSDKEIYYVHAINGSVETPSKGIE